LFLKISYLFILTPIIEPDIIKKVLPINFIVDTIFDNLKPIIKLMEIYIIERIMPFNNPFFFIFSPNKIAPIKNSKRERILLVILLMVKLIKLFCFKIVKIREKIKVEKNINIKDML
jgi:hypothetical protein